MSRVLLADDDTAFRDALQTLLDDAGHEVSTAGNGLEAVSAALAATPEVIVSDVHMPVLEGPDAISMLRAIPRFCDVSVILMSGEDTDVAIAAEGFLHKPFDPSALLDTLARVSGRKKCGSASAHPPPLSGVCRAGERGTKSAIATRQHQRIVRAFELVADQERRICGLERRGVETALAIDLYENMVCSVATLRRFEEITANPDLSAPC
ncbi:response regulator [Paraburkholderia sp. CNPSo 3272]|uniref:response regulator n=1 Tax=Paraburkholderia sp. CNPSo 3272 TaxID=2940931 RepID=UPI0020B864A2|nr:response regulator [Paraburkholderia sp. CNPSo 3272]MCP3727701.1 response regulator [Paraburkholderia sp. CNPSo 3272]